MQGLHDSRGYPRPPPPSLPPSLPPWLMEALHGKRGTLLQARHSRAQAMGRFVEDIG